MRENKQLLKKFSLFKLKKKNFILTQVWTIDLKNVKFIAASYQI